MAGDPLSILFGSQARVKLLRFFIFNPDKVEPFDEISRRARLVRRTARTEMSALEKAGVIRQKTIYIEVPEKKKKLKAIGYGLDNKFVHLPALQRFMFATAPINGKTLLRHMRRIAGVEFVVGAGAFVQEFEHRLDVLVAMKTLDDKKIANAIRGLEAELGIDIRFAAMSSEDLKYRISMNDKLIRDVFDYPHEVLLDKIGVNGNFFL